MAMAQPSMERRGSGVKPNDEELTVLVIEDDPNDAYFIRRAFEAAGIPSRPHFVENGREAIEYLERAGKGANPNGHRYPELILTDLKMPVANGFEVLEWLQKHGDLRVIPTIVFSSSASPEDVKRAHCLGATAYLCKPADPEEFKVVLSKLVRFWEECERPEPTAYPMCGPDREG